MRKFLVLAALTLAFAGCTDSPILNVSYMGQWFPPTDHVDVYFSEHNVKEPYIVMGRLDMEADDFANATVLQNEVQQQAAMRGADAVIITGFKRRPDGSQVFYDYDGFDDFYPWGFGPAEGMAVSTPIEEKELTAKLIKYQSNADKIQPTQEVVGTEQTESPF